MTVPAATDRTAARILPARRTDLSVVALDGDTAVYDPVSGLVHHLNASASLVFARCDGRTSLPALADGIAAASGRPAGTVLDDLHAAVHDLREAGLLREDRP